MRRTPWTVLGIAPTDDERSIRIAYTERLKTIDVDADPALFIELREAHDIARQRAQYTRARQSQDGPARPGTASPDQPESRDLSEPEAPRDPAASAVPLEPEAPPRWQADMQALQQLIAGTATREQIFVEVGELTERIISAPEMESIEHRNATERWIAETLLVGIPRTNGMLVPAINGFGWWRLADRWDCPPIIARVLGRHRDVEFVTRVLRGGRESRLVYGLLRDPAAEPRWHRAAMVESFLKLIRTSYPTVIADLSPEALEAWEGLLERRRNALPARIERRLNAIGEQLGRLAHRLYLGKILKVLGMVFLGLLAVAFIVGTHGLGLLFVAMMFMSRAGRE